MHGVLLSVIGLVIHCFQLAFKVRFPVEDIYTFHTEFYGGLLVPLYLLYLYISEKIELTLL